LRLPEEILEKYADYQIALEIRYNASVTKDLKDPYSLTIRLLSSTF